MDRRQIRGIPAEVFTPLVVRPASGGAGCWPPLLAGRSARLQRCNLLQQGLSICEMA
jgi:hypothetical protein